MWAKRIIALEIAVAAVLLIGIVATVIVRPKPTETIAGAADSQEGLEPTPTWAAVRRTGEIAPSAPQSAASDGPDLPPANEPAVTVADAPGAEAEAPPPADEPIVVSAAVSPATLVVAEGQATVTPSDDSGATGSSGGQTTLGSGEALLVRPGDTVRLEADSTAQLTLLDGSTIDLFESTTVHIVGLPSGEAGLYRVHLDVTAGRVFSRVQSLVDTGGTFEVSTPSSSATVRGTAFGAEVVGPDSSYFHTEEGVVAVSMDGQEVVVGAGEEVRSTAGQPLKTHPRGATLAAELTLELGRTVTPEEVNNWFGAGLGFGQIKQIYPLSMQLEETPDKLLTLREEGMSLGTMKQAADLHEEYGLSLDRFLEMSETMSLGQIKQELKDESGG